MAVRAELKAEALAAKEKGEIYILQICCITFLFPQRNCSTLYTGKKKKQSASIVILKLLILKRILETSVTSNLRKMFMKEESPVKVAQGALRGV